MVDREPSHADAARLEALRRRLYQPDASDDDRREFAALEPPPAARPDSDDAPAPARRRALQVPGIALAGVVAVAAALVLLSEPPQQPAARATPSASAEQQVVTGSEVPVALVALATDAPTPTAIPTRLASLPTRLQRFHGAGGTVVAIDTTTAQQVDGTLLVMITATHARPVHWYATRPTRQPGHSQYAEVVASGVSDGPAAQPAYGSHTYDGSPPSRLVVEDPGPGTWTLTVAFLPRDSSEQ